VINPFYLSWALSNEAEDILYISSFLNISAKKAMEMRDNDYEDFCMTLGLAKRKKIDELKLRGLIK